jgi:hypothetical protein
MLLYMLCIVVCGMVGVVCECCVGGEVRADFLLGG